MSRKVIDEDLASFFRYLKTVKSITTDQIYDDYRILNEKGHHQFKRYFHDGMYNGKNGYVCRELESDIYEICVPVNIMTLVHSNPITYYKINSQKIDSLLKKAGYD